MNYEAQTICAKRNSYSHGREIKLILDYVARPRGRTMLWLILAILAILWMLGSNVDIAGGLVHLLLISALILMVLRLLRGRHRIW